MSAPVLRLLGPPQLLLHGRPALRLTPQRLHQLLLVLGWQGSRGCGEDEGWFGRDELAELLWPDSQQAQARTNLRKLLLELRHTGLATPEADAGRLRWQPGSDVDAFAAACAAGQWLTAAERGGAQPLAGLDSGAPGTAWTAWLQALRRQHHQAWRAAAAQGLAQATSAQAQAAQRVAETLLQAEPQHPAALAFLGGRAALAGAAWAPASALVGRQTELAALLALLQQHRLVTLFGPGGVGKSRLARQVADTLAPRFVHGAALVMLDDLSTPGAVPARVADTLGLLLPPHADSALALTRLLAHRCLLLVLDGFEAVVDAAALVPRLLAAAPGLCVLVTSRERLDVDGEHLLPLPGLAVPAASAVAEQALGSPAVQLFVQRAQAVHPAFDPQSDWAALADICRRVGGLPLAIEWAAAWMRVLPAAELARELARGLAGEPGADLGADLGTGGGTGPTAVFESSWRLLTPAEREAYAGLAVFCGGFTREAAQQVAGVGLQLLAALVDKSMLRTGATGRLDMHPLVHAHARSKLALRERAQALAAAHARWYLGQLQRSRALPADENENVLAAWHHAVQIADAQAVSSALDRIQWSALMQGRRTEAVALVAEAAARFGADSSTGALLQVHQAWIQLWLEGDAQAIALAQSALPVLRRAGHRAGLVMCLRTLGHAARRACQPAQAVQWFQQALDLPPADPGPDLRAVLHDALGMALLQDGRIPAALQQFHLALAMNLAAGDEVQHMYNRYNLARAHAAALQPEQALSCALTALDVGSRCGFPLFMPYLHAELARAWLVLGRLDEALPHVALARDTAHDTGDSSAQTVALEVQARAAWARGEPEAARVALAQALRRAQHTGHLALGPVLLPVALQVHAGSALARRWPLVPAPELLAALSHDLVRGEGEGEGEARHRA